MNRKGLELLKQITDVPATLRRLIDGKMLPPQFLKFLSLYRVGKDYLQFEKIILDDSVGDEYILSTIRMFEEVDFDGELYTGNVDYIFDYETLEKELAKYENKEEHWNRSGFLQIGLQFFDDVLLIGMEGDTIDEIWRYGEGFDDIQLSKLDDNIFDFFMRLDESITEDLEDWKINVSDVYKKLNEKNWRVKKVDSIL